MAAPLTALTGRRLRNTAAVAVAVAVLVAGTRLGEIALRDTRFASGWLLLLLIVGLAAFELRKRVPVLPLGSAAGWQQLHIYAGWFAVAAFLTHTRFGLPDGPFETALWLPFVAVAVSGTVGIWLSRLLPSRMGSHGHRELYELLPVQRAALAAEAQSLALQSAQDGRSVTIADYYHKELRDFFERPRNQLGHLTGYRGHLRRRLQQIDSLNRYLDDHGRTTLARIVELVVAKDDLDHQRAAQSALRLWLFVHVPLAYALLVLAAVHAVLAYAFEIGTP
ncbi:MAG: hypothetical protein RLO51_09875 [Thalassobaculum sp.]|uniref:hypothetical protein n=1 Tax=Thalassobaculum sp. TaxID=2022740 RepID=UPI0032EB3154